MSAAHAARRTLARTLYAVVRAVAPAAYAQDGLISVHAHDFMRDADFQSARFHGVRGLGPARREVRNRCAPSGQG